MSAEKIQYNGYTLTKHGKKWKTWGGTKPLCLPLDQAKEAIDKLLDQQRESQKLSHVKTIEISKILEMYEKWAGDKEQRDKTTVRNVLLTWRNYSHLKWLHQVTVEEVEKVKNRKEYSNGTQRAILFNTRSILTFASEYGNDYLIDPNVKFIPLPIQDPKQKLEATDEHVQAVLSYYRNADWRLQMTVLALTTWGCRPATIPELLVCNYDGNFVTLQAAKAKNKVSQIVIVTDELRPFLDRAAKENAISNGGSGFLFHSSDGKPWTVEGIQSVLKRLHRYKILPTNITWYSFRIRKDNLLIKSGVDPASHHKQMGHSMRTIGETYARLKLAEEVKKDKPITYHDPATGKDYAFATPSELIQHLAKK
jgi:site-specific recombinase XerD